MTFGFDLYAHRPPCRANRYVPFSGPGCTCYDQQPRSNAMGIKTLVLSEREAQIVERALYDFADAVEATPPYVRWCERSEVVEVVNKHFPAQKTAGAKS